MVVKLKFVLHAHQQVYDRREHERVQNQAEAGRLASGSNLDAHKLEQRVDERVRHRVRDNIKEKPREESKVQFCGHLLSG